MDDPELEHALDGLIAAANYCDDQGHHSLSYVVSHLYQILGERELGDKEWYEFEEVFPTVRARGKLQVGGEAFRGDVEIEVWNADAVDCDLANEDAETFVEFWDEDDSDASGEFHLSTKESKKLVIELLDSLNEELEINHED